MLPLSAVCLAHLMAAQASPSSLTVADPIPTATFHSSTVTFPEVAVAVQCVGGTDSLTLSGEGDPHCPWNSPPGVHLLIRVKGVPAVSRTACPALIFPGMCFPGGPACRKQEPGLGLCPSPSVASKLLSAYVSLISTSQHLT